MFYFLTKYIYYNLSADINIYSVTSSNGLVIGLPYWGIASAPEKVYLNSQPIKL